VIPVVDVRTEIIISRPCREVADYAANPDNAPTWYSRIASAEWRSPRPLALGARIAFIATFLGRTLDYTYEIEEYVPGERLVMRTLEGPFPMRTEYTWAALDASRTLMTLRNSGAPSGFSRLVAPFMAAAMRSNITGDLRRLAGILEATDPGAPGVTDTNENRT